MTIATMTRIAESETTLVTMYDGTDAVGAYKTFVVENTDGTQPAMFDNVVDAIYNADARTWIATR